MLPTPPTSLRFGHLPSKLCSEGRLGDGVPYIWILS